MCIMCAVGDAVLEQRYYPEGAYWMAFAQYSSDNPRINGLVAFANAMIAFQNIVPISCVVTIAARADDGDCISRSKRSRRSRRS